MADRPDRLELYENEQSFAGAVQDGCGVAKCIVRVHVVGSTPVTFCARFRWKI
jgi:hypothetical protein